MRVTLPKGVWSTTCGPSVYVPTAASPAGQTAGDTIVKLSGRADLSPPRPEAL